jgi:putative aminopeptidase FrvX
MSIQPLSKPYLPELDSRSARLFSLVQQLSETPGPIGREEYVLAQLRELWAPHVSSTELQGIGNLVARVGGSGPKMLVDAHADEICFMVQSITPGGFLKLSIWNRQPSKVPGWLYPIGQPALVIGRRQMIEGVFAAPTGHIVGDTDSSSVKGWGDIFVDIGATSEAEARSWGAEVGARVIWTPATRRLGHFVTGKAMDNRAALAIMTLLLEEMDPADMQYELIYSVTVQEENGCTGALALCLQEKFDWAIALDVGLSGDLPVAGQEHMPVYLGQGPIIVHKDWVHYDPALSGHLVDCAVEASIPHQHAIFHNYGSDGGAFLRQGVRTALIAFPCRYTHSPFETVSLQDLLLTVDLLKSCLSQPPLSGW